MIQELGSKNRESKKELTTRTLSFALPIRGRSDDNGKCLTYEDVQETFGGDTPAQVMQNILNYGIRQAIAGNDVKSK